MRSLEGDQEWDKLECWTGIVWMVWPLRISGSTEGDVQYMMLLLFHQRPGAIQKLRAWMDKWKSAEFRRIVPRNFQTICEQADLEAIQQAEL